ncbi:MAG: RnfABCDGE type electron transport complex subunit G [Eubacteriales bacterium]|nr:RnfABCDGE type electron transport complex subunit G [Eubacteriales bacterium]
MAEKKKKSSVLVNTLVLFVVTLVAVLALAVVNQITRGPIEQAEINARAEIYKVVYVDAENFAEVENTDSLLEKSGEVLEGAGFGGCSINDVLAVESASGEVQGYVIAATSPSGYGGDIQIALGIKTDGTITGFDVVSNSETAGLGSKCTEPEFKDQFAGKPATKLEYTKSGASADNEIDAISGATITTNAVTEAVNAAIVFYQDSFGGGVEEVEEADPMEKAFPGADLSSLAEVPVTDGEGENYTVDSVSQVGSDGYIITVTAHNGYDGDLQLALGIGNDGIIKGYSAIVCNETPPLGGQCASDEFAAQFTDMPLGEVSYVASGADKNNNEIDAISGATITTKAVLTAVNGAVEYYNTQLKGE